MPGDEIQKAKESPNGDILKQNEGIVLETHEKISAPVPIPTHEHSKLILACFALILIFLFLIIYLFHPQICTMGLIVVNKIFPAPIVSISPYYIKSDFYPHVFGKTGGYKCADCFPYGDEYICSFTNQCGNEYGGVYWLNPSGNWGESPGLTTLFGYKRIKFQAKGEIGAEKLVFRAGDIKGEKYTDPFEVDSGVITLSDKWETYSLDLSKSDLSMVIGGFSWDTSNLENNNKSINFSIMNIRYE